ncbi:hypothetical protein GGR51DRAFT_508636 [Nemania sp. FL0031]|nr:hypothetical protein GGR51DRAFT_508636 [Nemania sp. FL0031]
MADFPSAPIIDRHRLRKANSNDLDSIVHIHIQSFAEEPMDNYCYPDRFEEMESHLVWLRKEYEYYLENPNKYLVHVTEPTQHAGDVPHKPVALAVWNIDVLADAPALDRGLGQRKDANKKHVEAYIRVASERYKPHGLFSKWGGKQLTLSVLAVLPKFRRQGIGKAMVRWGINAASEKGWPVTVCASPMGQLLYEHLKFVVIRSEVIQAEGEEASFSSEAMVLSDTVL